MVLNERIIENGIRNIRIVEKDWEDVYPEHDLFGRFDIVISSLSLDMTDLRAAVEKMVAVCSGTVNIYWFADTPFWEKSYYEIWPELHGESYCPGPKVDCLFMVLLEMGIFPDVEMMTLEKKYRFRDQEEMFDHFRSRFGVTDDTQEKVMRNHLLSRAREEAGRVVLSGDSVYAKVFWKTGQ